MSPSPEHAITLLKALDRPGKPLLILFAMLISKKTLIGEGEIAELVDANPKTVRKGLDALKTLGLITRTHFHNGWQLTTVGRQLMLSSPMLLPQGRAQLPDSVKITESDEIDSVIFTESQASSHGDSVISDPSPAPNSVNFTEYNQTDSVNTDQFTESEPGLGKKITESPLTNTVVVVKTDSLDLLKQTTNTGPRGENQASDGEPVFQAALRICNACESVLGDVLRPDIARLIAETAPADRSERLKDMLGWIAEAYDLQDRFDDPAAIAANAIRKNWQPKTRYRQQPGKYLPAAFLEAAGLAHLIPAPEPEPQRIDLEIDPEPEPENEPASKPPDPSITTPAFGGRTALYIWGAVIDQLRMEMPKAAFDTMVRPLELARCDPQAAVFVVCCPTEYACKWVQSRLSSTVARLLTGMCARQARAEFVFEEAPTP